MAGYTHPDSLREPKPLKARKPIHLSLSLTHGEKPAERTYYREYLEREACLFVVNVGYIQVVARNPQVIRGVGEGKESMETAGGCKEVGTVQRTNRVEGSFGRLLS